MMLVVLAAAMAAGAQTLVAKPAPALGAGASGSSVVATVGPLRIAATELEQQVSQALRLYRDRNRAALDPQLEPIVRRQVLENLIRQRLLVLESRRSGVTVSDAEADAQLRRDPMFQKNGVFDEAKYLAIKASNPAGYAQAIASLKEGLASRKMGERMDRETRPDDTSIRAEMERQLTHASMEFLSLARRDFDGSYPEPREAEIQAYYAANSQRYRRPVQATVSVIQVNRPSIGDSAGATDAGFRAWEQRMRARADSALSAIRAGARFAALAALHGGMKSGVTFTRDQPPDFWRGGPHELEQLFTASAGTVLPEPVHATSGWALVRVDTITPAHIAPLREVAREIRRELRSTAKAKADDRELREIYAVAGESLRGDGYRLRYALVDTASFAPGEPTAQDLDRFYRAHLADYSSYDKASGAVIETPFAAVRGELVGRWAQERRRELARTTADRLRDAWSRGRRDVTIERSLRMLREIGPVPSGGAIDSGQAGQELADELSKRGARPGVAMIPSAGGYLVYELREVVAGYLPTFEQARPLLFQRLDARRALEEEAAAAALFEKDPAPYRLPGTLLFSRLIVEPPPLLDVELTRDEVERFYRAHLNDYSVQEVVRVRHILISPSGPGAEADAAARRKAEDILKRVRAGEDFAKLAAEFSDDPATRDNGGDVGVFRHGQMREAFERAAFAMRPGDITGPVQTEVGYHVMECIEYVPGVVHPIAQVYANVAHDCALLKANRIAAARADSLYRTLKSVADAKAVARRLHLEVMASDHPIGQYWRYDADLRPFIKKLETVKPGQLYPGTQFYTGLGQVIAWVDSILPARLPSWEEAKAEAVARYRRQAGERALLGKKAELDSMLAGGWSFDSLATLWGGPEKSRETPAGSELGAMGGRAALDSLVFGRDRPPVLEPGQVSDWIDFPGGYTKLRVAERLPADPGDVAKRVEQRHQLVLWRNLKAYFDRLKARYPVEILDGELRATDLAEPTEQ
jgi:parvulin-like peptidyl-prolyl isomerase